MSNEIRASPRQVRASPCLQLANMR